MDIQIFKLPRFSILYELFLAFVFSFSIQDIWHPLYLPPLCSALCGLQLEDFTLTITGHAC